ncbi:hypothetical protein L249_1561, partial [Ophiocordyceps polyrhachis-furcata BCC 54312]
MRLPRGAFPADGVDGGCGEEQASSAHHCGTSPSLLTSVTKPRGVDRGGAKEDEELDVSRRLGGYRGTCWPDARGELVLLAAGGVRRRASPRGQRAYLGLDAAWVQTQRLVTPPSAPLDDCTQYRYLAGWYRP